MQLKTTPNINPNINFRGEGASVISEEMGGAEGSLDFAKLLTSKDGELDAPDETILQSRNNVSEMIGDEFGELTDSKASFNDMENPETLTQVIPHNNKVDSALAKILVNKEQNISGDQENLELDTTSGEVTMKSKLSLGKDLKGQGKGGDKLKEISTSFDTKLVNKPIKGDVGKLKELLKLNRNAKQDNNENIEQIDISKNDSGVKTITDKNQKIANSAETNLALMQFGKNIKSTKGAQSYQKELKALNQSLIKSPIHQELVDNNKKMNSDDGSFNSQEGSSEFFSFDQIESKVADQTTDVKGQKVIDLSNIKTDSKSALIKEVTNYIEQSYIAGKGSIDLLVRHEELGDFRIVAQKTGVGQQVSLEIATGSSEAHQFFAQHETELMKTLQDNGVKLSQMKIVSKSESVMISDMKQGQFETSHHEGRGEYRYGEQGNFSQRQQSQGQGSDRRRQLWQDAQKFREQQQAA